MPIPPRPILSRILYFPIFSGSAMPFFRWLTRCRAHAWPAILCRDRADQPIDPISRHIVSVVPGKDQTAPPPAPPRSRKRSDLRYAVDVRRWASEPGGVTGDPFRLGP